MKRHKNTQNSKVEFNFERCCDLVPQIRIKCYPQYSLLYFARSTSPIIWNYCTRNSRAKNSNFSIVNFQKILLKVIFFTHFLWVLWDTFLPFKSTRLGLYKLTCITNEKKSGMRTRIRYFSALWLTTYVIVSKMRFFFSKKNFFFLTFTQKEPSIFLSAAQFLYLGTLLLQ